jgi:two-component sensor histidine kinase
MTDVPPKAPDALEQVRRHRAIVTNLARLVGRPRISRSEFFDELVLRVAQAIEIQHVKLLRYRPEHSDLLMEAGCGWKAGIVGTSAMPADMTSPTGRTFRTAQPSVIEDVSHAEGYRIPEILIDHGIVSLINVPIMVDGAAWGVLEADSTRPGSFSADTEELLVSAAALAGLAITRSEVQRAQDRAVAELGIAQQRQALLHAEMHHRVKNNFQLLLAMIALRAPKFPHEFGRTLANQLSEAIIAMSLAHDQLHLSEGQDEVVELGTSLNSLLSNIEKSSHGITTHLDAAEMDVGIEKAVPLGLIVNEAIRNAMKHAFPGGRDGDIHVVLCPEANAQATLSITDNGIGGEMTAGGSGMKLIKALAAQVGGDVKWQPQSPGMRVRVTFPRRPHRVRS